MRRVILATVGAVTILGVATVTALAITAGEPGAPSVRPWPTMITADVSPPLGWRHAGAVTSEFDYLAEMVAHHEEAVDAAEHLQRSPRPEMRAFGHSVVRTQSAQIEQMRHWLAQWYPGRSADVEYEPMMRDLAHLTDDELDRTFLQDMVPHHMVAVMRSQQLLVHGLADHAQVNELAKAIRDEQHAEMFQMGSWLRVWFGAGWGPATGMGGHMGGRHATITG